MVHFYDDLKQKLEELWVQGVKQQQLVEENEFALLCVDKEGAVVGGEPTSKKSWK